MSLIITKYGTLLLRAMGQTLLLALCGLFFACILGMIFGMLSVLKNKVCNIIAIIFVDVVRGVPMIVLAYFVFFGIPYLFNNMIGIPFTLTALQAGTICLALNCGAYMAEIIRAGIQSVDKGQMEAARSLGLPYWRAMLRVVLPQAIRTMIPKHHQPVHYHVEGYLHFVGYRISGTGQYSQERAGKHFYVFPDLGNCWYHVSHCNYNLICGCKETGEEAEPWPLTKTM